MNISVALCTYNGEKFIGEQIDSILYQTKLPDEIVICDDGSSDSTIKLAEQKIKNCGEPIAKWVFRNPIMHKHAKSLLTRLLSAAGPCA
jgi:glycosyltransferase involved in cell wall biosynthesis